MQINAFCFSCLDGTQLQIFNVCVLLYTEIPNNIVTRIIADIYLINLQGQGLATY